ncbi:MAG: hypothetical protein AAGJ69_11000, partial [Cyanobacteria bacterium J06559_1]
IRKAGHGQTTSFSLGDDLDSRVRLASRQTATAQSAAQKWLSIVAIAWGFVGTALYFSGKSHKGDDDSKSTGKPTAKPALESARTVDNRATVTAGFGSDGKATAEESR